VPDAFVALPLVVLVTVAVSAAAAAGTAGPDLVHAGLLGVRAGQAVVAVWAVQAFAGEYGSGLARATFTALPRRLPAFAAKALLVLAGTAVAAILSVAASVLTARLLIDGYPGTGAGPLLRASGGSVLYLLSVALLGLGVAAAVRHAVAATGVVLGLLYLAPAVINLIADPDWQRAVYRSMPGSAGLSILSTVDLAELPIGPWAGLGVAAAWGAGAAVIGVILLARRDV
jgi:ABC-2 type transport system permease protein